MQCTIAIPYNEVNFTSTKLAGPLESYSCFSCALLIFQNLVGYKRDIVEARSQYLSCIEQTSDEITIFNEMSTFSLNKQFILILNEKNFLCNRTFIALC